jgi:hypothetical protein
MSEASEAVPLDQETPIQLRNAAPQNAFQPDERRFVRSGIGVPFELIHNAAEVGEGLGCRTRRHR